MKLKYGSKCYCKSEAWTTVQEFWQDRSFLLAAARRNPEALLQVDEEHSWNDNSALDETVENAIVEMISALREMLGYHFESVLIGFELTLVLN